MNINFVLNSKAFSINKYYYRNRKRTQEARKWADEIHEQLYKSDIQNQIKKMRESFDALSHVISITYTFRIPVDKFFTKKGHVSRRSMDLTNVEKTITDLIFDPRYFERDGIPNLCIDDQNIVECISRKVPAEKYSIDVSIKLLDIKSLS
jgi:Holliday junction resolvase RusA-like endonuclease